METAVKTGKLTIGSTAFAHEEFIPVKYTCDGENTSPPITVENIPSGTKSMALIMDDPDAPDGTFTHWVLWNIRPMEMIIENAVSGMSGRNSFGETNYEGPCPPPGASAHRYFFKVYALDTLLDIPPGSDRAYVEKAMKNHILAEGEMIGMYRRAT